SYGSSWCYCSGGSYGSSWCYCSGRSYGSSWCWRRSASSAGSDTHVIQVKEGGRVVEYEMQVSIGSGYHIVKSKQRVIKTALNRLRYESNTTERSPKTIGS